MHMHEVPPSIVLQQMQSASKFQVHPRAFGSSSFFPVAFIMTEKSAHMELVMSA